MSMPVHRFLVHACPSSQHPNYFTWQTAQICIFVGGGNRILALETAESALRERSWLPIGPMTKETLIEEVVLEEGGDEVIFAYREAQAGKVIFMEGTDQIPMATKDRATVISAPRIDESFMDRVVEAAKGRRLTEAEADAQNGRNADYIVKDSVIELKDIQKEGLWVESRQDRLAQLLVGVAEGEDYVSLAPAGLSEDQWRSYLDVLGRPIQNQVKSAGKQIRASRDYLGLPRGGVIFLNTGYSSIPPRLFEALVERYCHKDTSQVDFSISISTWVLTNGFDSGVFFSFAPSEGGCDVVKAIRTAFWQEIDTLMTNWARGGFVQEENALQPIAPIAFSAQGKKFSFNPPHLPSQLDQDWRNGS